MTHTPTDPPTRLKTTKNPVTFCNDLIIVGATQKPLSMEYNYEIQKHCRKYR